MEIVAYVLIGIFAGLLAGLLGIGGGMITVPCLAFFFLLEGFPQGYLMHMAIGTSLASAIFTGIASTWAHNHHKPLRWDLVRGLLPGIVLGTLLGAYIAYLLTGVFLEIFFGLFAISYGAYMLFSKRREKQEKMRLWTFLWIGFVIGAISSLLGIGGGIITVPLLMLYSISEKPAIGASAATGTIIAIIGSLGYLYFGLGKVNFPNAWGYIYLPAFIAIGAMTVIFAPLGAKLAHRLPSRRLGKIFAVVLILTGLLMVFR